VLPRSLLGCLDGCTGLQDAFVTVTSCDSQPEVAAQGCTVHCTNDTAQPE
jgi:hypothetical protein